MKIIKLNDLYTCDEDTLGLLWNSQELVVVGTVRVIEGRLWFAKCSERIVSKLGGFFGTKIIHEYKTMWCPFRGE